MDILASHEGCNSVLGDASVAPSFGRLRSVLTEIGTTYLLASKDDPQVLLLAVFVIHVLILDKISIQDRARRLEPMKSSFLTSLSKSFLPRILRAIETVVVSKNVSIDIDIRVFLSLLRYLSEHQDQSLMEIFGSTLAKDAGKIFSELKFPPLDFSQFREYFLPQDLCQTPVPLQLLPFTNRVFDEELSVIHIATESVAHSSPVEYVASRGEELGEWDDSSSDESTDNHPSALSSKTQQYSENTLFSDTRHWHNHKMPILPKHLGGDAAAPMNEWQRNRKLRSDQRFMKNMHDQASTLTGASGAVLQQVKIPPVSSNQRTSKVSPFLVQYSFK